MLARREKTSASSLLVVVLSAAVLLVLVLGVSPEPEELVELLGRLQEVAVAGILERIACRC